MREKISEIQLIGFLSNILEHEDKITLQNFIKRVEKAFILSKYDLGASASRPSEARYVQRCRNINCHDNFPETIDYRDETFYKN